MWFVLIGLGAFFSFITLCGVYVIWCAWMLQRAPKGCVDPSAAGAPEKPDWLEL